MGMENAHRHVVSQELLDKKARIFELLEGQSCWRCGGTGRYSFNMKDKDVCYGCGGSGHNLTTVGRHAYDAYRKARIETVPIDSIKKGDVVEWDELMIEACTTRTVISRITSKRTDKKRGKTTLSFHNRKETMTWDADFGISKVNEEVRVREFATNTPIMNNIIQVSLPETNSMQFEESDIVLFTAAKVPNNLPANWVVANALMPAKAELDLYFKYGWKGKENKNFDPDWYSKYTPLYLETINNEISQKWIAQIVKRASEGRRVFLVCYCSNKSWCHTSLVKNACYDLIMATEWEWKCGADECPAGFASPGESCMSCVHVKSVTRKK